MKKQIKQDFRNRGIISRSYIQRKYKVTGEYASKMLEEISIKSDKKEYSGDILIRLTK